MRSTRRLLLPVAATFAASAVALAAPAAAKGGSGGGGSGGGKGGGGGSTTPAPPPPTVDPCAPLVGKVYSDGTVANEWNLDGIIGGCAVIQFHDDFTATVYEVLPQDGWTYRLDVRNQSDGTRVTIDYTETATGRKTSLQMEPGKTIIRQ